MKAVSTFFGLLLLCCSVSQSAEWSDLDFEVANSLPRELGEYLRSSSGHEAYALSAWLNPYYLQADLNGDGQADIAVLVREKRTGKRGILFVHIGAKEHYVVGAGHPIGSGGDDFSWMDAWYVRPRGVLGQSPYEKSEPPALLGAGLIALKTESASGLVYWTGMEYGWYQQSD